jgi:mRNA export factor
VLQQNANSPVLCVEFSHGSVGVFFGTATNQIFYWDLPTNQISQVGQHNAPVKDLYSFNANGQNLVVSGGFDGLVTFWMMQNPQQF